MIEHIALIAASIRRPIKMADLRTDSLGQILEGSLESPAVERAQGRAYGINRDEVDVSTERGQAQRVGLADRLADPT